MTRFRRGGRWRTRPWVRQGGWQRGQNRRSSSGDECPGGVDGGTLDRGAGWGGGWVGMAEKTKQKENGSVGGSGRICGSHRPNSVRCRLRYHRCPVFCSS